jgi:hypothetical protein
LFTSAAEAALESALSEAAGGPFNLFTWAGYDGLGVPR